jgi:signal transduction histidine kinase
LALKDGEQAADDAEVEQELRNRFMDRSITRGKDVSDGILTSIASVARTLESSRVKIYTDPYGYEQQVHQLVLKLELALRDLRACVLGPSSRFVRTAEFTAALDRALSELRVEFGAQFDVQVDEDAVASLGPEQLDRLLKVAREAATNALRHGRSRMVSIKLQRSDSASQLVVQDNGRGFVPDQADGKGKGLALMRTLAEEAGGRFEVTTRIGNGARAVVTVPGAAARH